MRRYQMTLLAACFLALSAAGCDDGYTGVPSHVDVADYMRMCDGDTLQQFVAGEWVPIETCQKPAKCQVLSAGTYGCSTAGVEGNIPDAIKCVPGAAYCMPDRRSYTLCDETGTVDNTIACDSDEICADNGGKVGCIKTSTIVDQLVEELGENSCTPQEAICTSNALVRCNADGKWDAASVLICNEHEECIADGLDGCFCQANTAHCFGNRLSICNADYKFSEADALDCGSYKCDAEALNCVVERVPECVPQFRECNSGLSYKICDDKGFWGEAQFCKDNETCSDGVCIPKSTPGVDPGTPKKECEPGERKCFGERSYAICTDDGKYVSAELCPSGQTCLNGLCEGGVDPGTGEERCITGSKVCAGNIKKTCSGGAWTEESCGDKTCVAGECVEKTSSETGKDCKAGERKCVEGGYLLCSAEGKWSSVMSCGDGNVCREMDGSCVADVTVTECVAGQKRCITDTYYQICKNGVFTGSEQCSSRNQSCFDGECLNCKPDSTTCNANNTRMRTCKADGSGYEEKKCDLGCSNGACNVCQSDSLQCSGSNFERCVDGRWTVLAECGADACSAETGKNGCGCTVGAKKCDDKGNILECKEMMTGGRRSVKYTTWQMITSCGSVDACKVQGDAPICVCKNDDKRCMDNAIQVCKDGMWVEEKACGDTMTCDSASLTCKCAEASYLCGSDVTASASRSVCKSGEWTADDCPKGSKTTCNSALSGACVATQCESINTEKMNEYFKKNNIKISIENTGLKCDGSNLLDCSNGIYSVKKTCTSGCTALGEFAVCSNNPTVDGIKDALTCNIVNQKKTRCGTNNTSVDVCTATGMFKYEFVSKPCASGEICVEEGGKASCVEKVCASAELKCDGTKVMQCTNNKLNEIADCASIGLTCKDGVCK